MADLYERRGDLSAAAGELRTAAKIKPRDVEPHRRLAAIYRRADYLDREVEELHAVLKESPDDWRSALRLYDIYKDAQWLDDAERALALAVRPAPNEKQVMLARATLAYLRHRYPQMDRLALNGLNHFPNDPDLMLVQAEAERLQNRYPAAEQHLRRAIALPFGPDEGSRSDDALAHLLLMSVWSRQRFVEAEQVARVALQKNPQDKEAHYWLARALDLQGKSVEAETHYAIVARQDVGFESVAYHLGRWFQRSADAAKRREGERLLSLYKQEENNARAFAFTSEKLRKQPANPEAHREMAAWYVRLREYPKAILELRRALQLLPGDTETRRQLVSVLRSAGRSTEAAEVESHAGG